ncbi:MAG TPA: glycoside hydrolase family 15, partial [Microbacterium sp.]|nr:glycoside hydrolase family 15 [Microbacterium sp.]
MSTLAISDHALLSDRHSAAVVTRDGCVAWLCFPRFDSESVFASLLDDEGGHWWIRPADPAGDAVSREYLHGTMVLRSTYCTDSGTFEITEAMELGPASDPHRLGEDAPHTLLRTIRCTSGRVSLAMEFRPRPAYGLVIPTFDPIAGGVAMEGGLGRLILSTTLPMTVSVTAVTARFALVEGESAALAMQFAPIDQPAPPAYSESAIEVAMAETIDAWRAWSDLHQTYRGPWQELVHHSGRVLQALSYQPTGAIIAAATTSLPEVVGGERNWDYRYSWVRDASFTMQALWVAACPDEAQEFFTFMADAGAASLPEQHLQIMFGVGAELDLTERHLPHLRGWRGSAPVRVGNGAWDQPQLDVYGELLDAAFLLRGQL